MTSRAWPRIKRVQAKPAGIAAQVEHRPARAKPGELAAAVALIAEEAGLVAAVEMDAIANSMLLHGHARRQPRAGERPAREILLHAPPARRRRLENASSPADSAQSDRIGPIR